jgi:hypothetical protein
VTQSIALLLLVSSAAVLKHSGESTTGWLLLGHGVLLCFLGRRVCHGQLIADARRLGLRGAAAKVQAKRWMQLLTR